MKPLNAFRPGPLLGAKVMHFAPLQLLPSSFAAQAGVP